MWNAEKRDAGSIFIVSQKRSYLGDERKDQLLDLMQRRIEQPSYRMSLEPVVAAV